MNTEKVLRKIPNEAVLDDTYGDDDPVRTLIEGINSHVEDERDQYPDSVQPLTSTSTGREMKDLLSKLDIDVQSTLLTAYQADMRQGYVAEDPEKRDERKLKIWVTKALVLFIISVCFLFAGGIVYIAVKTGELDEKMVNEIMYTATEFFRMVMDH